MNLRHLLLLIPVLAIAACSKTTPSSEISTLTTANSIIGGNAATDTDAVTASTAYVMVKDDGLFDNTWICTGTLISKNLVLTAAHCVTSQSGGLVAVYVFFGAKMPTDRRDPNIIKGEAWLANPKFTDNRMNDVGLIKLATDAPAFTAPVPVLADATVLKAGDEVLLAGFGIVNEIGRPVEAQGLNYTKVPVAEMQESFIITDQTKANGGCAGDSGGPAYVQTAEGLIVAGITRGPKNPAVDCRHYGEYTSATFYKDFIVSGAQSLNAEAPTFKTLP